MNTFKLISASMLSFALLFTQWALVPVSAQSQKVPAEMYYSSDGKTLYSGGKTPTGLYERATIRKVYINFTQPNYWSLLTANYATEGNIHANMTAEGASYPGVGVRFRGNTSYTGTGTSQKKSFAIETDFVNADQTFMGYKNLKFNNAHEDPTFMREVLYNRMASRHTPIAKANYVRLYLNNEDWGIYANIQAVDKTFLKEWFMSNDGARFRATVESQTNTAQPGGGMPIGGMPTGGAMPGGWGDGTAGMNYLGNDSATYKRYYDLKSSDISDSWQKLITACQTLSTATAATLSAVKTTIDVDKALWFLAVENIFTDDDSYVMKGKMDYYVYYEPETGRTMPIEYDGNSSFQAAAAASTAWTPFKNATNVNYPLLQKLLSIPEYRQRYLAHYRTILQETFTEANANAIIDELNTMIASEVASDTKKLYSTAQYTSGVPALKSFVATRRAFLLSNAEAAQVAPAIASAPYFNAAGKESTAPAPNETVSVRAKITSASGVNKVNLYYASGVVGNFTTAQMFDDGVHNDGAANDGVYGGTIPGFAAGTFVRYYVEAIANNSALSASYMPPGAEHDVFVFTVSAASAAGSSAKGVVVNELVASNTNGATDEAGDFEDWIELYNTNAIAVDLSGLYLSDSPTNLLKWKIPTGTTIPANGYLLVWADEEAAEGPLHANFKLSASGESVILSDSTSAIIDQITFPAQTANMSYARVPNGTGGFVIQTPSPRANNGLTSTSVRDISGLIEELALYPVPVSGMLTAQFGSDVRGKTIEIYNAYGQLLLQVQAESSTAINVENLPQGVYYLRCGGVGKKFVKN